MVSDLMRLVVPRATRGFRSVRVVDLHARHIHATPISSKSVTEKVSEVADKVNKKVGQGLASAIETGEKATEKTEETLGASTTSAKQKAEKAKQTVHQTGEQAKQKANEFRKAAARARESKDNVKKDL
ncbi:hypothetical protein BS17DRAFT_805312 [Gyrodon lividus]|nr:hypothetical protein BS17DRAFT_805312 [Gyrodon lividus]